MTRSANHGVCDVKVQVTVDNRNNIVLATPNPYPIAGLTCTLEEGHTGPHIAQGIGDREIFRWENES